MSNRRRTPSEKAERRRCTRCSGRLFIRKGDVRVCMTCGTEYGA